MGFCCCDYSCELLREEGCLHALFQVADSQFGNDDNCNVEDLLGNDDNNCNVEDPFGNDDNRDVDDYWWMIAMHVLTRCAHKTRAEYKAG